MENASLSILVVVSHDGTRQMLTDLIRASGQQALEAFNEHDGLAKFQGFHPDMVIIDHSLTGFDGVDLVRSMRNQAAGNMAHIILVVRPEEKNRMRAMPDLVIDDFITKPLRPDAVAAQLRVGQRIARLQRENQSYVRKLQQYSTELSCVNLRVRELAMTDDLTGLPNRRHSMELMQHEWLLAAKDNLPLTCMSIDLDGLRRINDEQGHERGDVVIKTVAAIMRKYLPARDVVCRTSGDEFLVICPGAALESVLARGEKIVSLVGSFNIQAKDQPLGLSIGVAERRPGITGPQDLINLAEQAMYYAKSLGPNQVYSGHANELRSIRGTGIGGQANRNKESKGRKQMPLWRPSDGSIAIAAGV